MSGFNFNAKSRSRKFPDSLVAALRLGGLLLNSGFWLVLLVLLADPVLAAALFRDDFQGGSPGWDWSAGQGSTGVDFNAGGSLRLQAECCGPEFPLVGRNDLFTGINAYWRFGIRFRYPEVTAYGTNLSVGSGAFDTSRQPAGDSLRAGWHDVLGIHQVRGAEHYFEISAFGTTHYRQDNSAGADTTWHTVELEVNGPTYRVLLDGAEIGSGNTPAVTPWMFWAGNYAIQPYWGNWSDIEVDWIQVETDRELPATLVVNRSGTAGNSDWWRSRVGILLNSIDNWSGVGATEYRIDGGATQPYSGLFSVGGEGTHTLECRAIDRAGNIEGWKSESVSIDSVPPASSIDHPTDGQWVNGVVSINGTAADATSGVAGVSYSVNGGATWNAGAGTTRWNAPWDTTAGPDGNVQLDARAEDVAGNVETPDARRVHVDNTPPQTTASPVGMSGNAGWWRSPVSVTLAAVDAGIGLAGTEARIDGGTWTAYVTPFLVQGEGTHTVEYHSTDQLGNPEPEHSLLLPIDTLPPTTVPTFEGRIGSSGWWRSPVTVTLNATDAGSGVAATDFSLDSDPGVYTGPFLVDINGVLPITFSSMDAAGNREAVQALVLRIDPLPPKTTLALTGTAGDAGWWRSGVTASLATTDTGSGPDLTVYQVDGEAWRTYLNPRAIVGDGAHTLAYNSIDVAGNSNTIVTETVRIDTIPPRTTAALAGPRGCNGWYTGTVTATFTAEDATAGVAETDLDGAPVTTPIRFATDGRFALPYFSLDRAGNREIAHVLAFDLDTRSPEAFIAGGTFCPECGELLILRPQAGDGGSGLNTWRLEIRRGTTVLRHWADDENLPAALPWNGEDATGKRLPVGTYEASLTATDRAGWSRTVTGAVQITAAPPILATPPPAEEHPIGTPLPTMTATPAATPTATRPSSRPRTTPTATPTPSVPETPRPTRTPLLPTVTASPTSQVIPVSQPGLVLPVLIFQDDDRNAKRQTPEPGLPELRVVLAGPTGGRAYLADTQGVVTLTLTVPGLYTATLDSMPGTGWSTTSRRELLLRYDEDGSLTILDSDRGKALPVGMAEGMVFAFGLTRPAGLWLPLGGMGLLLLTGIAAILDKRAVAIQALSTAISR